MAEFVDLNAGDPILASDLNKLADDIGDGTLGHQHSGGTDGHATLKPDAIGDGASITWDGRLLLDKGGDLASGSTITPGTDGNFFDVTGTTTITAIASLQAGTVIILQFDDAVQITHNATSLILEGAVNRTTEAKDVMMFLSLGSGNWQEISRSLVTPTAAHTVASHSDTSGTGTELNTLTDGSNADSLHVHVENPVKSDQTALEAETSESQYVSPELVKFSPGVAKVWVSWEQTGAHGILSSYNMTSVTDGGAAGDTDHLWNIDFSSDEYAIVTGARNDNKCSPVGSTQIGAGVTSITVNGSHVAADNADNYIACFGDQ